MPDTYFTASPDWGIYVILYFFVGGIAGGSFFLGGLFHLFGKPEDRPTIRAGYYIAFVGAGLSALLLTLDLTKPLRFWHMLIESNTGQPMWKSWVPMSVGSWALVAFGGCAFLAALGAWGGSHPTSRPTLARLSRGAPGTVLAVLGCLLGLFIAGYTGVILSVTNRPIWADSTWLGALFLLSGVSTATATLVILGRRVPQHPATSDWLVSLDRRILVLELIALVVFIVTLGPVARAWVGWSGVVLLLGVVGVGILAPLVLERAQTGGSVPVRDVRQRWVAAAMVLVGGFLLRTVTLVASAQIHVTGAGVVGR